MAELLRSLQDSQLVARFQRRCGLFPAPEEGPRHNGPGPAEGAAAGRGAGAPAHGLRSVAAPQPYVQKYVVKNYFYYYLFRFSAALGQEVFYITFLPFTHWNIDPFLSRRLIIVWVLVMYIGQVAKDILKWPRPLSPPVVKLEKRVIAEYGMPSTHAMAATVISFTLLISTRDRYQYPFVLGLLMAVLFSTLVCLSRLYTGMHTVLDVLGGIAATAVLLALTYPAWSLIDRLDSASPVFPVCAAVVPFLLCYHYPAPDFYSPTRADTTTILAAGAGVTIGSWINHFFQLAAAPAPAPPLPPRLPPWLSALAAGLALSLTKFAVGIALVLAVRRLVQALSLQVLCSWFRVVPRDREARRRLEIEVPYKFVTYASVGICATTFVPMLHRFLGLP
ncbi:LOW QUALITY PROTEIN: sphingosine-1-phosphate phosphatase 2 isoform X5 [Canis lupus familiaris]|uniref:LOW QUALITY PROTEIN: sphingosine-1-phosphate phosphatase 2 isoform X5 n=1 Tax=Canis lupus familiaris TaxID=9615 RepID=UPI000DC68BDA|nr:LOW QUALITY PROTEIN: sphingosine-1-phosphate phosphatase 2 isoform X5 [Canis lupus familiaris]